MAITLGERLHQALKAHGIKQKELARQIDVAPSNISSYISGSYTPGPRTIRDICNALHINEEWLRDGTGDMDAPADDLDTFIAQFKPTPSELRLFQIFSGLPDDSKEVMLDMIRTMGAALEEIRAAESAESAQPAPLKLKGEPVPPPAGPNIMDEDSAAELEELDSAAAHDIDGVSPYIPESEADSDNFDLA